MAKQINKGMPEEDRSDRCFLRAPLPAFSFPCSRAPRSWWPRLWQQPAESRREPSVPPPQPLPSRPHPRVSPTLPHPTPVQYICCSTLRLAKAPGRLGSHLIFLVIQKITVPPPSPCASGRSFFFFFFFFSLWRRSSNPSDPR